MPGEFLGRAAELHVMAEFLARGWNVADPDIDRGSDLFAIRRSGADLSRIQVKTNRAESRQYGYNTQIRVPSDQVRTPEQPPLYYAFTARLPSMWGPLLIIPRADLHDLAANEGMGSTNGGDHDFWIQYHGEGRAIDKVVCEDSELTEYLDDFSRWPRIER